MVLEYIRPDGVRVEEILRCKRCKTALMEVDEPCAQPRHRHGQCKRCDGPIVCVRPPRGAVAVVPGAES